jgi:hypothetical protein
MYCEKINIIMHLCKNEYMFRFNKKFVDFNIFTG